MYTLCSADLEVDSALGGLPVDLPLLRSEPYCLSLPNFYGLRTQHQDYFHIIYVNNKEDRAGHLRNTTHWEHLDMSIFAHMYYLVATHVQLNCAIKLCNMCAACVFVMFLFLSVFKCVSSTYSSESVGQLLTNYLPNTIRFDQGDEET